MGAVVLWAGLMVARGYCWTTLQRGVTDEEPTFEVVSIRVNVNRNPMAVRWRPDGSITFTSMSAIYLVQMAFPDARADIVGLPKWALSGGPRFDVIATVVPGRKNPDAAQRASMIRKLLIDRFNFKTHFETRIVPTYDLVFDKKGALGAGLKRSDKDCQALEAARRAAIERARGEGRTFTATDFVQGVVPSTTRSCDLRINGDRYEGDISINQLLPILGSLVGRDVVDKTGLQGSYRLALSAVADDGQQPFSSTAGTSVFTAVREQLGLRLVSSRGPVRVWIIDRLDLPSEN
jgi:uncharacterized protein (TIGR03435 family)